MIPDLIQRYLSGDRSAGDQILREHDSYIKRVASKATRNCPQLRDDMTQACRLALLKCLKNWDPGISSLITYSYPRMHAAMWDEFITLDTVRMPHWLFAAVCRAKRDGVPIEAMAERGLTPPKCKQPPAHALLHPTSTDAPLKSGVLGDRIPCGSPSPEEQALSPGVVRALEALPDLHREVLLRRVYGDETLEEIGADVGLSRERVRQIENQAKRALAKRFRKEAEAA